MKKKITAEAIALLDKLIATPSVSRDEAATADIVEEFLRSRVKGTVRRIHNNVYVRTPHWDEALPTLLINSHHDTVKPSASLPVMVSSSSCWRIFARTFSTSVSLLV